MTTVVTERLRLFHAPDDLYGLVLDVRRYPEFISQITAMRVLKDKPGDLTAEARIRYKFVTERFVSRVQSKPDTRSIDVSFVAGPFRELENRWRFHQLSDGSTLVDFFIRAAFKNSFLQMLLESQKDRAAGIMVGKFEAEANRRFEEVGDRELDLSEEIHALIQ